MQPALYLSKHITFALVMHYFVQFFLHSNFTHQLLRYRTFCFNFFFSFMVETLFQCSDIELITFFYLSNGSAVKFKVKWENNKRGKVVKFNVLDFCKNYDCVIFILFLAVNNGEIFK